jgi:hypothetical protein
MDSTSRTLLTGNAKQLDDLVEDDVFRASVTVLGKMDYDTQIGGNTTDAYARTGRPEFRRWKSVDCALRPWGRF